MSPERRYPTDLTDGQWSIVESLLPSDPPRAPGGRPLVHGRREIVNAIFYLNRAGCAWRMLPKDFPPWQTVYWYFARWRDDGTLDKLHDALREQVRSESSSATPSRRRGSWTPSRSRAPTLSPRPPADTTERSESMVASAISWLTRSACCWW